MIPREGSPGGSVTALRARRYGRAEAKLFSRTGARAEEDILKLNPCMLLLGCHEEHVFFKMMHFQRPFALFSVVGFAAACRLSRLTH